jgi:microcystin-dependent protein
MADKTIVDLTELETPVDNDLLLIVNSIEDETKKIKLLSLLSGAGFSTGDIKFTCRQTADPGFLICDGSDVSRTTYSDLFAVIGETYGEGDGTDTFNLPDLRGKVAVPATAISDDPFEEAGMEGGETEHTLTVDELPSHTHGYTKQTAGSPQTIFYQFGGSSATLTGYSDIPDATDATGGGEAHNNLQPYVVISTAQIKY